MNLLPKTHKEFGSADYWEKFFRKRGQKSFEWYGEYAELCGILHKYIKPTDKILNIGCGSSTLSADLYDVGHKHIVNIDISATVIKQMTDKYLKTRPDMKYIQMDMLNLTFEDGEFGVVLDKGTLDALLTDDSKETLDKIDKMFSEISRVLKIGGRYVCVSLAQDHILNKVTQYFPNQGWMTRVCRVTDSDKDTEKEFHMPVFVYVFTKFKQIPGMKKILEVAPFEDNIDRYDTVEQLVEGVKLMQNYGIVRQQLNKGTSDLDEHISLDLFGPELKTPRYTVHVVDSPRSMPNKFAAFIVPEGREIEWLFSSYDGRKELAKNAGFQRLLVVTLHREHTYNSMDDVKEELNNKVLELAPADVGNKKIPYLSIGDDINQRVIKCHGNSTFSGDFVVEDVEVDKETIRRLIFMSNKTLVQSEAKLVREGSKKKSGKRSTKLVIDPDFLPCNYYSAIVAGLSLVQDCQQCIDSGLKILLVGLGGGSLPAFIHRNFEKVTIDVIEIDNEMVNVATNWFGFTQTDRLKVTVADGLKYVEEKAGAGCKYDVIIIDVDNKDTSVGMNCPPEPFVKREFLTHVNNMLSSRGLLILNMACRNWLLRNDTIDSLKAIFNTVFTKKLAEEINEIVYAFPSERLSSKSDVLGENKQLSETLENSLKHLQESVARNAKGVCKVDLCSALKGLSIS